MVVFCNCVCSHIGENGMLVTIKEAGHAVNLEKPKEFLKHLKWFLVSSPHKVTGKIADPPDSSQA